MRRLVGMLATLVVLGGCAWIGHASESAPPASSPANRPSESGPYALSRTGRFAAFTSRADNLVAGDTNGVADVFVKDLADGSIERVSANPLGTYLSPGNAPPVTSDDGKTVLFVTGDPSREIAAGLPGLVVRDRTTHTSRVLHPDVGTIDAGPFTVEIRHLVLSGDGHTVAFDLEAAVENHVWGHLGDWTEDLRTGTTLAYGRFVTITSLTDDGTEAGALVADGPTPGAQVLRTADASVVRTFGPGPVLIAGDGNTVAHLSLIGSTFHLDRVRVSDGAITPVATNLYQLELRGISDDGGRIAGYRARTNDVGVTDGVVWNVSAPTPEIVVGDFARGNPENVAGLGLSGDGRFVSYVGDGVVVRSVDPRKGPPM
jgi:hypothetical protein